MSRQVTQLGHAVADPFAPSAKGVSLPSTSPAQTHRVSSVIRFDTKLDAGGGYRLVFNPAAASDVTSVWSSNTATGTPAGTSMPWDVRVVGSLVPTGGGSCWLASLTSPNTFNGAFYDTYAFTNLPYDSVGLLAGPSIGGPAATSCGPPYVRGRIVCAGVKMTFNGNSLNDGGTVYVLSEPNHENMNGATAQSYATYLTSTKIQRLALRDTVSINLMPIKREQEELSEGFDLSVANMIYGCNLLPGAFPYVNSPYSGGISCGFNGGTQNYGVRSYFTKGLSQVTTNVDPVTNAKRAINVLYPLSRSNASVYFSADHAGVTLTTAGQTYNPDVRIHNFNVVSLATTTASDLQATVITMVSAVPTSFSGYMVKLNGQNDYGIIEYDQISLGWRLCKTDMSAYIPSPTWTVGQNITFALIGVVAVPPVISALEVQGGVANAGQQIHVEVIVHVEYSGYSVQGRTQPCVPDAQGLSIVQAGLSHAREKIGQSESKKLNMALHESVNELGRHMPEIAMAATEMICPEATPFVAGGLAAAHGLFNRYKRKHT